MTLKFAILASGNGSNFQAIQDCINRGVLDAECTLVVCNRPNAYVLERAKQACVPYRVFDHTSAKSREEFDGSIADAIHASGADTVVLAGYMRIVSSRFLQEFSGRVLNIHPSLLPSFKGIHGVDDAKAWGVKVTGCTVHFVDENLDHGPIIIQAVIPVKPDDTLDALKARIQKQEYKIYPQALKWLGEGRLSLDDQGRTVILQDVGTMDTQQTQDAYVYPPLEIEF